MQYRDQLPLAAHVQGVFTGIVMVHCCGPQCMCYAVLCSNMLYCALQLQLTDLLHDAQCVSVLCGLER